MQKRNQNRKIAQISTNLAHAQFYKNINITLGPTRPACHHSSLGQSPCWIPELICLFLDMNWMMTDVYIIMAMVLMKIPRWQWWLPLIRHKGIIINYTNTSKIQIQIWRFQDYNDDYLCSCKPGIFFVAKHLQGVPSAENNQYCQMIIQRIINIVR